MKITPNLGLKKPDQEDFYNVDDFNYNADKLDEEVARRIINAGSVPSIQAGLNANKPTPGTAGRLYVATDTQAIYRDTGTEWKKVGVVKWGDIEGKPDLALASDLAAHLAEKATHGVGSGYYIAKTSRSDQLPAWNDIQGKPSTFPPSTHQHNGSDITSPVANATNADTVDGKHASDFMSATKVYGVVTYSDSIPPNTTLQKTIALGGNYRNGRLIMRRPSDDSQAALILFGTNNLKTIAVSSLGSWGVSLVIKEGYEYLVRPAYAYVTGNNNIVLLDVYISGSNLIIVFKNIDNSSAYSLNCRIHWEVW